MEGLLGKTLDKTYRIDQLLGKGGFGAVYRARDVSLNRDVAIKVMHPHFTDDEGFRARFLQEARAVAALNHPDIVQIHAFGQDLGLLYIVMDFVPGQTLHAWLKRLADEKKIVALTESLDIVRRVGLALHYAHEKGVLHRDIKPPNILLKPTDVALREPGGLAFQPVLTDFGLAKLAEGGIHTQTGMTMGTPAYMSPEQCMGRELDRRADIYSLGVVLFELTTGRVPFEAKSLTEAIRLHTQEPPPPPRSINPTLPAEVENIVLRTLAKDPAGRFATARELADALKVAIGHIPAELTVAPTRADIATPYVSLMTRMAQESVAPATPSSDAWGAVAPVSQPGASLVVVSPDSQSQRLSLVPGKILTIGRVAGNDLVLPDQGASRHHARIEYDGQQCTVTDLNSTNGTFLGTSRLLPGVGQSWPVGVPLRIGQHWLRFETQAAVVPGVPSVAGAASVSPVAGDRRRQAAPPNVALEPEQVAVEAGQRSVGRLRILNQGSQVDHFSVGVDGIPPTWIDLPKEPLRLTPNEEGIVPLAFQPPREPGSAAGAHPFSLRIISQADPRQTAQVNGSLAINPFYELAAEMAPQQVTTGRARLKLDNRGNTATSLAITATDPAEALDVRARPAQLALQAGQRQEVPLEARPKKGRPWFGLAQRYPFEVAVVSSLGQAIKQGGMLIVKPIIPAWVIPLVGLLLALICGGAGIGYKLYTDTIKATATAQTATAVAAVTVTATTDSDGDGLTDATEIKMGTNPLSPDTDKDGLNDKRESELGTDPLNPDTDGDGLSDGEEIAYGANPLAKDSDGDTLPDGQEVHQLGTSPVNRDTDGDGQNDNVDPDPGKLPTLTPTATNTPTPTLTPTGTSTPEPTGTPTATPAPTDTPTITPTPELGIVITRRPGIILTRSLVVVTRYVPVFRVSKLALVYGTDLARADAFKALIESRLNGVSVDIIPKSKVVDANFSGYGGIIVTGDTGSGPDWGDVNASNQIAGSGKPVLGLGRGGAALFQVLGLSINWGNSGVSSQEQTMYVLQAGHAIFGGPVALSVPGDQLLQIYNTPVAAVEGYGPRLAGGVAQIGRDDNNTPYITLSQEGVHILWGYEGGPDQMTESGQNLFANVVSYLMSQ